METIHPVEGPFCREFLAICNHDSVKVLCPTQQKKVILETFFPANLLA